VILSGHGKGLLAHADAAHHPLAAGAQIGLHLRGLENFPSAPHHFMRSSGLVSASKIRSAGPFIVIS
jgi:hypothetical protein